MKQTDLLLSFKPT